jgi:hypothetical protein
MAPLSMLCGGKDKGAPRLAQHFNIVRPLVVDGQFRQNEAVTIARFWKCDGRYWATAFEGETIEPKRIVTGNAAHVRLQQNVPELFERLIRAGLPHHVVLFYGKHARLFEQIAAALGLGWVSAN